MFSKFRKNAKVTPNLLFGFFCVSAVLMLPLRTYQLLVITEAGTGFYVKENFSVILMYCLMFLTVTVPYFCSWLAKDRLSYDTELKKRLPEGVFASIFAATLIYDAVMRVGDFSELYSNFSVSESTPTLMSYLTKSGASAMLFEGVFAVASCSYFMLAAVAYFRGSKGLSQHRALALMPLAWCVCRIIHRFMRTISFTKVADLFLELVMLVCLMTFFLAMAQVNSRLNEKQFFWKLFGTGVPAAVFCLVCFVPRMILVVIGRADLLATQSPPDPCDLAAAMLILATLLSRAQLAEKKY